MLEFKGWTPETVDNLTFDQLDAIINELNSRMGQVESHDKIDLTNIPSAKGTGGEIAAWCKAGCPPTFDSFVRKLRKG